MSSFVSIVIPNYNHAEFLEQRILSVLNQTFRNFEVIILDDFSSDKSREVIERYRNVKEVSHIVYNDNNSGSVFRQWEKGISLASGNYLWIAESDDWADPIFLERTVAMMEQDESLSMVFCGNHWIDANGNLGKDLCIHQDGFIKDGVEEIKNFLVKVNTIQNVSSVLFRKEALKKVTKTFVRYTACGDWILYTELLCHSRVAFLKEKLNYYRYYHANTSRQASKAGLWQIEGIDVLSVAQKFIIFTKKEKEQISLCWQNRIHSERKEISLPLREYLRIQLKLFRFAPSVYMKNFLPNFWKSNFPLSS